MTGKERIIAALTFREFDRIPVEVDDCCGIPFEYPGWFRGVPVNTKGKYTDGWGCGWEALEDGVCGEVKYHPLANVDDEWPDLSKFTPPYHILDRARIIDPEGFCRANPDKFIVNCWEPAMPNLFERMQHLRGTEQLFLDIASDDEELYRLRDILMEYYMKQWEIWCRTPVDAVQIHDDWGSQRALLINPEAWRRIFKPVYKRFCDTAHRYGKFVLMHSDGYIADIIPDLIEIGVNAVNSQLFCMPVEELFEKYHHKICFWGEIDRQHIQVFGTADEMRGAVRRIYDAFSRYGNTGFVAQCTYTMNTPRSNMEAERDEWDRINAEIASRVSS